MDDAKRGNAERQTSELDKKKGLRVSYDGMAFIVARFAA